MCVNTDNNSNININVYFDKSIHNNQFWKRKVRIDYNQVLSGGKGIQNMIKWNFYYLELVGWFSKVPEWDSRSSI